MTRQPAVFFGHGSPMNALGGRYADDWRRLGEGLDRPRGVVMVSAHWETQGLGVTSQLYPPTIHDFGGFPPELHAMQYPAMGSPDLAMRVHELTGAQPTEQWGLDHGTWAVLCHFWPKADVPIVQLSLDRTRTPQQHFELGQRLAPLRDEGILIAGSGDIVHNLRRWKRDGGEPYDWAKRFNAAAKAALERGDAQALIDWHSLDDEAALSVPTDEHYLPLLYVAAQRRDEDSVSLFSDVIEGGSISMTGVRIG